MLFPSALMRYHEARTVLGNNPQKSINTLVRLITHDVDIPRTSHVKRNYLVREWLNFRAYFFVAVALGCNWLGKRKDQPMELGHTNSNYVISGKIVRRLPLGDIGMDVGFSGASMNTFLTTVKNTMLLTIFIQFTASLWQAHDLEFVVLDMGHNTCMS